MINGEKVIKSFKELDVYNLANDLAVRVYAETKMFPANERFGMVDQLRRAATSIGANISEGFGRYHTKDFIKFLYISRGSLMEVQHFLIFSERLGLLEAARLTELENDIITLNLKINNLIGALSKKIVARKDEKSL